MRIGVCLLTATALLATACGDTDRPAAQRASPPTPAPVATTASPTKSPSASDRTTRDSRFAILVAALTEVSPEFREWWAEQPVHLPEIGRLDLEMFQLRPVEHPDLLMVLQIPASEADLQRATSLLRP